MPFDKAIAPRVKTVALASFLAEQIANGKRLASNSITARAKQNGLSKGELIQLICDALRANGTAPPRWLDAIRSALRPKSLSKYQEHLVKQKGFKSLHEYQKHLAKNRFVSIFASLLEGGMPVEKAARMTLPLTQAPKFPIKKLDALTDEAVRRSKQKKLPARCIR